MYVDTSAEDLIYQKQLCLGRIACTFPKGGEVIKALIVA
jgi:hypothetical protein